MRSEAEGVFIVRQKRALSDMSRIQRLCVGPNQRYYRETEREREGWRKKERE